MVCVVTFVVTRYHRYDEIRNECVAQLLSAIVNDTRERISHRVSAVIDRHSRGDLEHVGDALSLLWNAANQRGGTIPPHISSIPTVSSLTVAPGFHGGKF